MNTDIHIHLTTQAFDGLQQAAIVSGRTPVEEAAATLEQLYRPSICEEPNGFEGSGKVPKIEDHFGSIDMGYPICIDNEQIDADLARAYGELGSDK